MANLKPGNSGCFKKSGYISQEVEILFHYLDMLVGGGFLFDDLGYCLRPWTWHANGDLRKCNLLWGRKRTLSKAWLQSLESSSWPLTPFPSSSHLKFPTCAVLVPGSGCRRGRVGTLWCSHVSMHSGLFIAHRGAAFSRFPLSKKSSPGRNRMASTLRRS